MSLRWRRLARRHRWIGFLAYVAWSYQMARRRGRGRFEAIRLGVAVARWHYGGRIGG